MRNRERVGFIILSLLTGSLWIPKRLLVGEMPLLAISAIWACAVMTITLGCAAILRVRWPDRKEWHALLLVSLFMLIVPQGVIYLALQHLQFTPVMAETMRAAGPLFIVLMTPVLKAKNVPHGAVHWMIAGFGGVLLMFDRALHVGWQDAAGISVAVLALLLANGTLLYAKRTLSTLSPILVTGLLLVLPAAILVPAGLYELHGESLHWSGDMVLALALLCLGGALASVLAMWLLQGVDAYRVIMVRVAVPLVMMAESWWMLGSRPGMEMMVAAGLIVLSVVSVLRMRDDNEKMLTLFAALADGPDAQPVELH